VTAGLQTVDIYEQTLAAFETGKGITCILYYVDIYTATVQHGRY
jgi:hypothetical protein